MTEASWKYFVDVVTDHKPEFDKKYRKYPEVFKKAPESESKAEDGDDDEGDDGDDGADDEGDEGEGEGDVPKSALLHQWRHRRR